MPMVCRVTPAMRYTISAFFVLVEAPSRLETEIGVSRRAVTGAGRDAPYTRPRRREPLDRNRTCGRKYVKSSHLSFESFRSDSVGLAFRRRTEERRATVEENADISSK